MVESVVGQLKKLPHWLQAVLAVVVAIVAIKVALVVVGIVIKIVIFGVAVAIVSLLGLAAWKRWGSDVKNWTS